MDDFLFILQFVATSSWHMLPFFLVSIVLGAAINIWDGAQTRLQVVLGTHPIKTIVIASILGALSPFCSCGVIPIITGMLTAGIPIAPVLAFWISSPLMDPETFIITYAGLGLPFALGRTLSAISLGIAAGIIGLALRRDMHLKPTVLNNPPTKCGSCCSVSLPKMRQWTAHAKKLSLYLGKWLLLAFFLEALIVRYLPNQWIEQTLGTQNIFAIPIAALVGVPLYINTLSAVPIIAGLLAKGMAPGAALTFLVAGPVTSIPAMIAVTAVARKKLFLIYIVISLIGSMAMGYLYQLIMAFL